MEVKEVKKYIGVLCYVTLKNDNLYTIIIPKFDGDSFSVIDRDGEPLSIDCDYIALIDPVNKKKEGENG